MKMDCEMTKIARMLDIMRFRIRKSFFGFHDANRLLLSINKLAVIPILKANGANIGDSCDIESPLVIHNCDNYEHLVVGSGCHIGKNVFLDLKDRITLEPSCTVSMGTTIITHIDVGKSMLSTRGFPKKQDCVLLEKGSYVGANVTILHGVTIGRYAVISAGAVVTADVPPYTLAGGVPARRIRKIR